MSAGNSATADGDKMTFSTGAVRGTDATGTRYDLLSPVALDVIGAFEGRTCLGYATATEPAVDAARSLTSAGFCWLAQGDRSTFLAAGAWSLLVASHIESGGDFKIMGGRFPWRGIGGYARAMAEGAAKYGEGNWLKGFPVRDLINHAIRHVYLWLDGDRTEDHLGHAVWNAMTAIHFDAKRPELWES